MSHDVCRSLAARLMGRFGRLEFVLLPPGDESHAAHLLISQIREFRASVFDQIGSLPQGNSLRGYEDVDRAGWHVAARATGRLLGCIRFVVLQTSDVPRAAKTVVANSGCGFDDEDLDRVLATLQKYIGGLNPSEGPLVQAGGLAVDCASRGSGLAALLSLSVTSFMRAIGSPAAVAFATEKFGGVRLYERAGCFPLPSSRPGCESFFDHTHSDLVQILGGSPLRVAPSLEPVAEALSTLIAARLRTNGGSRCGTPVGLSPSS
jgi:hypothetical protein